MPRMTIPSVGFFSPRTLEFVKPKTMSLTTTLFVNNLHCSSCVTHAHDTLGPVQGIHQIDVNLIGHTICVQHEPGLTPRIADVLIDAAFEVSHVTTSDSSGHVISTHDVSEKVHKKQRANWLPFMKSAAQRRHIANCQSCQADQNNTPFSQAWNRILLNRPGIYQNQDSPDLEQGPGESPVDTEIEKSLPVPQTDVLVAKISVGGMTCPACSNSITSQLKDLDWIEDVDVNLIGNSATVTFRRSEGDAAKVVEAIEDCGFDATLDSVEQKASTSGSWKATFTIEGMTCGSCVATVTTGLEAVEGVSSVNVNLQGALAVVELTARDIADSVLEAIEDLGFDGSLVEVKPLKGEQPTRNESRTVEFEITGMYCQLCPGNIVSKLKEAFPEDVDILSAPTQSKPRIILRYKPRPPTLTVRKLKSVMEEADQSIEAKLYHAPTMEERSKEVQTREWHRILFRLLFSLVAAVPSFVIGVLYMSLVSVDNTTRQWFEQPIWAGTASRMDWAMFITSTFVMFYGADIFHRRAANEVWALWRPKSKVPLMRRLYRFGSMNLLISAGTGVAYFSSLAILIMAATSKRSATGPEFHDMHRSLTYFDTVVFLTLFILCGKFLQAHSKAKTGEAVAELGKLRPTTALLVEQQPSQILIEPSNGLSEIPVGLLEVGDIVCIRFGESPPTDGIVDQDGTFLFDESSLTGESKPVKKVRGDTILTGSVNKSDPVRITVTELGGKSMLDQIIAIVQGGQSKRAPVERFADFMTSYFTPVITLIAILTWVIWLGLGQSGVLPADWLDVERGGWAFWSVEFAIAVFVVACPCGLGLAAPTALFVGGGLAAKAGILVQGGGEAFQEASRLNAIVFDKTGTLTEGEMRVTDFEMLEDEEDVPARQLALQLAAAMEESSTHPIAKAILTYSRANMDAANGLHVSAIEIKEVPGCGMTGSFDISYGESNTTKQYEVQLGNERFLTQFTEPVSKKGGLGSGQSPMLSNILGKFQNAGCSTAALLLRQVHDKESEKVSSFKPISVFAITDPIRAEASAVLQALRAQKVEVHMCTGDNESTARAIASQLGIPVSNIRAGVLPQEKAEYIQELQSTEPRQMVAFVGDGTNDAPALTAADVSIALSSGSDIAAKSASFILLNSNLETILTLVRLARRVFLRVKLNFAWAAVYNVALIPVAAGVFFPISQWRLSPAWAALAMAMSSVSVVLSSLALKLPEIRLHRR